MQVEGTPCVAGQTVRASVTWRRLLQCYLTFQVDAGALECFELSWQDPSEFRKFDFAPYRYGSRGDHGLTPAIAVPGRHPELILRPRFQVERIEGVDRRNAHLSGIKCENILVWDNNPSPQVACWLISFYPRPPFPTREKALVPKNFTEWSRLQRNHLVTSFTHSTFSIMPGNTAGNHSFQTRHHNAMNVFKHSKLDLKNFIFGNWESHVGKENWSSFVDVSVLVLSCTPNKFWCWPHEINIMKIGWIVLEANYVGGQWDARHYRITVT